MNEQIMRLWVNALLSKKYKQGFRKLKENGKFCALGVLCDLYSKATKTKWEKGGYMCGNSGFLMYEVKEWAEMNYPTDVMEMNDAGKSFKEIAQHIVENYGEF